MDAQPPDDDGVSGRDPVLARVWLYKELLRIESHWTMQLQNQQARISTVLTVNGFLLAFLGIAAFTQPGQAWPYICFYISVGILALALVPGIGALLPRIPIAGSTIATGAQGFYGFFSQFRYRDPTFGERDLWLDARTIRDTFVEQGELTTGLLDALCLQVAENADGNLNHSRSNQWRRTLLHWELGLIIVAILPLEAAIIGLILRAAG